MHLREIGGQPGVAELLNGYLQGGQLSHAYLFYGPAGVGKLKIAKAFATDILAASHPETAHLINTGQHPDYLQMQREGAVIRIEDIRNMEKWLYQKPYWAARRVVIINEAQYLNRESGNALLKTLEEPPTYAIIILVANNTALLPTIVSRCQMIRFGALSPSYIEEVLLNNGAETDAAHLAANMAEGSLVTAALLLQKGPQSVVAEARQLLLSLQMGKGQAVVLKAEAMEKDSEQRRALYAALRYLMMAAVRGQETSLAISGPAARAVLVKMDQQRQLEKVNASQLFLSLEMLWSIFDLVKPA